MHDSSIKSCPVNDKFNHLQSILYKIIILNYLSMKIYFVYDNSILSVLTYLVNDI